MKNKYWITILILLVLIVGIIIYQTKILNSNKFNINEGTDIGDRAPGFVLKKNKWK